MWLLKNFTQIFVCKNSIIYGAIICQNVYKRRHLLFQQNFIKTLSNSSKNPDRTLKGLFEKISKAFQKHPLLLNSIIYGSLYTGAEFSQQTLTKKILNNGIPTAYDPHMITRIGILGAAVFPQIYYFWYKWLDRRFRGTSFNIVIKKICLDQFILTPPLLVIFFLGMSLLESKTEILAECQEKLLPTFGISCIFWIPAQAVNFTFIPNQFRIAYIAACAFVWINILCYIKTFGFSTKEDV